MEHDQERLLDEATLHVRDQATHMKRAIDNDCLRDALKYASNMLCELRTSFLSPKNYYELYMAVFQELQHLAAFFGDRRRHGRRMSELYESVQHAGNILPRLYLLVTVGCCYIRSGETTESPRAILADMTELCKGVQHPMRGLFLRYYLTQMCRDTEGPTPSESSTAVRDDGGMDPFEFLFQNFAEAARLWVRLQHQGAARDRQKREKERHDLRVLVGANLVRMSQLEEMTPLFYSEVAAKRILKQITSFKDVLAQQYLLDCVVQVFSDECHIQALPQLLNYLLQTHAKVDLKPILLNLMERLASFAKRSPESIPKGVNLFDLFHEHILKQFQLFIDKQATQSEAPPPSRDGRPQRRTESPGRQPSAPAATAGEPSLTSLLQIEVAFLNFTIVLYPDTLLYVDRILCAAVNLLSSIHGYPGDEDDHRRDRGGGRHLEGPAAAVDSVMELLSTPLRHFSVGILHLDHFPNLLEFLNFQSKRRVAFAMVAAVLEAGSPLDDTDSASSFFTYIAPILKTPEGGDSSDDADSPSTVRPQRLSGSRGSDSDVAAPLTPQQKFLSDQQQVARLLHLVSHPDTDEEFAIISAAWMCFSTGGALRKASCVPASLVFCLLRLVPRVVSRELGLPSDDPRHPPTPSATSQSETVGEAEAPIAADSSAAGGDEEAKVGESSELEEEIRKMRLQDGDSEENGGQLQATRSEDDGGGPQASPSSRTPVRASAPTTPPHVSSQKVLHAAHKTCMELVSNHPETAVHLLVMAAIVTNDAEVKRPGKYEAICYEFLTQALVCFEEELSDSKAQIRTITTMVGALSSSITCLESDNYETLAAKITQHSARLLRKAESCRAVLLCSRLFWFNEPRRNPGRVVECLQKCLKIADAALNSSNSNVVLFVEIFQMYSYYFSQGMTGIAKQALVDLASLCAEHLSLGDSSDPTTAETTAFFRNVLRHIYKKEHDDRDPIFRGVNIQDAEGAEAILKNG